MSLTDSVVRAMTDDGAFRIVAARTTDTAREILRKQKTEEPLSGDLAQLATCAVLYRETMAPSHRVQCIVRFEDRGGQIIADSHPDGWTRGLVQTGSERTPPDLRKSSGLLEMMRTLPNGDLHRSIVRMPENGNLSEAFMSYMQQSEQVVSMISLGASLSSDPPACGGFVVQLLPEAKEAEAAMAIMTERLEDFVDVTERLRRSDASPTELVEAIFDGMPFTWLHESKIRFGCQCSRVRVMTSLSTLAREDIQELIEDRSPLDLSCEYCGTVYVIEVAQLQGLLATS